jgi:3-isopropylmalate/(R)-2-methylmalate dehydratase small subunit
MEQFLRGRAHIFGDDINTDYIIAGKYTKTLDYDSLASRLFEDLDPEFTKKVSPGDFIVAGENFGCGSSREQAPIAIKYAGIGAVLARSFARIFFRNAINLGVPALVCDTRGIEADDELEIDLSGQRVTNVRSKSVVPIKPLAPVMVGIINEGGLVPYLKKHGDFQIPD